jgi:CRP-like cAMP-binding protein
VEPEDGEEDEDDEIRGLLGMKGMKTGSPVKSASSSRVEQLKPASPAPSNVSAELDTSDLRTVKAAAFAALCETLGAPDPIEGTSEDAEVLAVSPGVVLLRQGKQTPGVYVIVEGNFEVAASTGKGPLQSFTSSRGTAGADNLGTDGSVANSSLWDPIKLYGPNERRHIQFLERPLGSPLAVPEDGSAEDADEVEVDKEEESRPKTRLARIAESLRKRERRVLGEVGAGCILGYFPVLTGYPSFSTVTAKAGGTVVFFPRAAIERLVDKNPTILSWLSSRLLGKLPSLSLYVDLSIEWLQARASQVVCKQGAKPDAIYVVLSGRLRSIVERKVVVGDGKEPQRASGTEWAELFESQTGLHHDDEDDRHEAGGGLQFLLSNLANTFGSQRFLKRDRPQPIRRTVNFEVLGEYGQGESFGEAEVVTDKPVPATVHAIRDSEIAVIPATLFDALATKHPEIMVQVSRVIAMSAARAVGTTQASVFPMTSFVPEPGLSNANLKTVAIVPVNRWVHSNNAPR